jgi:hypothetical protein
MHFFVLLVFERVSKAPLELSPSHEEETVGEHQAPQGVTWASKEVSYHFCWAYYLRILPIMYTKNILNSKY